ncbi:MAG TPA: VWA domain-containing protein [Thermoanaerobaculia bacterium]|nr:VWA domain-containing protein [Thermoanaerobaculia bacterium]
MTFAVPSLLWLVLLGPAAGAAALWLWRRRLAADAAWAARGLWKRLLPAFVPRRLTLSVVVLSLAVLGAAFALARPRWGSGEQKVERKGVDVVFLVDSSLSMGALDAPPSRLFVAKSLVRRMTRAMPGNRVGLVQTEGDSVALAPLTLDGGVIDLLLDAIDPGSLPTPGTELAPGVETALKLFGQGSEKHRVLVILSDGEDFGGGLEAEIAKLKDNGVIVYALGIGTPEGTTVPIPGSPGEVKKDQDGNTVVSQLHEDTLEKLARATGGDYLRATSAAADPTPLVERIDRLEKRTIESESVSTLQERFQWPLALAALALLVYLGIAPFAPEPLTTPALLSRPLPPSLTGRGGRKQGGTESGGVSPLPAREGGRGRERGRGEGPSAAVARAHALPAFLLLGALAFPSIPWTPHLPSWVERWMYNPRERTDRSIAAYKNGKPKEAVAPADTAARLAPNDPTVQYDAGTAHLGAGEARQAVKLLEKAAKGAPPALSPAAHYNLGNARLAAGDAAGAVEAFRQTLREQPANPDAKYNLELALREEQKQKMGGRGNPPGSRGERKQNQDPSNQPGKGNTPPQNQPQQGQQSPNSQQQAQPQPGQGQPQKPGEGQDSRLPQFRNQPDMNAQEAASVLSAVENLERQQRRDLAAKRARQQAAKGKDW